MSNAAHIFQPECTLGSSALWHSEGTQGQRSGQSVRLLLVQVGAGRFRAVECSVACEEIFGDAIHEALVSRASPLLVRSHASGHFRRPAALGSRSHSLRLRQWVTRQSGNSTQETSPCIRTASRLSDSSVKTPPP